MELHNGEMPVALSQSTDAVFVKIVAAIVACEHSTLTWPFSIDLTKPHRKA